MVITRSPAFSSGSKTAAISERPATCRAFLWPWVLIASTKRSALIPILLTTQEHLGHLSDESIAAIARYLELPEIEVYVIPVVRVTGA